MLKTLNRILQVANRPNNVGYSIHLPAELWLSIADNLAAADLKSFSLTCRAFNDIITPLLFRRVSIPTIDHLKYRTARPLVKAKHLHKAVQHLTLDLPNLESMTNPSQMAIYQFAFKVAFTIEGLVRKSRLHRFSNIRSIKCSLWVSETQLWSILSLPLIEELEASGLDFQVQSYKAPKKAPKTSTLTRLKLSGRVLVPDVMIAAISKNLKSLEIDSLEEDQMVGPWLYATYPFLESFSITVTQEDSSIQVTKDFLSRHPTIISLALDHPSSAYIGASESILPNLQSFEGSISAAARLAKGRPIQHLLFIKVPAFHPELELLADKLPNLSNSLITLAIVLGTPLEDFIGLSTSLSSLQYLSISMATCQQGWRDVVANEPEHPIGCHCAFEQYASEFAKDSSCFKLNLPSLLSLNLWALEQGAMESEFLEKVVDGLVLVPQSSTQGYEKIVKGCKSLREVEVTGFYPKDDEEAGSSRIWKHSLRLDDGRWKAIREE